MMVTSCVVLQACAAVPVGTALALRKVDPMTTDVAQLRVAYVGPPVLRVDAGKAKLEITAQEAGTGTAIKQAFALEEIATAEVDAAEAVRSPPGMVVRYFRLPAEEAARLERTRDIIVEARAEGSRGRGTVSVQADGCLLRPTQEPLLISAYLRTVETGHFVPLFERMNLREVAKTNGLTLDLCQK